MEVSKIMLDLLIAVIAIATVLFDIVVIVKFFNLCSNVKMLTKQRFDTTGFTPRFRLYVAAGSKDKALDLLLNYVMNDRYFIEAMYPGAGMNEAREELHRCYDKHFKALDLTLDFNKVDELLRNNKKD